MIFSSFRERSYSYFEKFKYLIFSLCFFKHSRFIDIRFHFHQKFKFFQTFHFFPTFQHFIIFTFIWFVSFSSDLHCVHLKSRSIPHTHLELGSQDWVRFRLFRAGFELYCSFECWCLILWPFRYDPFTNLVCRKKQLKKKKNE